MRARKQMINTGFYAIVETRKVLNIIFEPGVLYVKR
jgi:hypothetical protein